MKKISFVVQGPISERSEFQEGVYSTYEVLASIRNFFPEAEIILSTWKGSDTSRLIFDKLILNDDPGSIMVNGIAINVNRLIASTKAGLIEASNPIVVKTRTDVKFISNNLYNHLHLIVPIKSKFGIFNEFVLSTAYYVRNPIRNNWLFHPTDIFLAGKKEDILSYFEVPLASKNNLIDNAQNLKMVAEQYLFIENIIKKRNRNYNMPYMDYVNLNFFLNSERYLFNNFTFFTTKELGIEFPHRLYNASFPATNYTIKKARQLSDIYLRKPMFNTVILERGTKYVFRYYLFRKMKRAITKLFVL